jgi:short-subunit dehydrogenase
MESARRTALITGASTGIGYELAELFATDGYDLVLVARSKGKLNAGAKRWRTALGIRTTVVAKDLSDPATIPFIARLLHREKIMVDVLVNNAGFGLRGEFATTPLDVELEMIQVNVVALTRLTKLLLPAMIARSSGRIMNVSSTAGFQPGPRMAVYYASKAYVLNFSEALAEELVGTGVTVTALCPGPVRTGFAERAGTLETRIFKSPLTMDVKPVAEAGYRGLMRGKRIVIPGVLNWLGVQANRISPRVLTAKIIKSMKD